MLSLSSLRGSDLSNSTCFLNIHLETVAASAKRILSQVKGGVKMQLGFNLLPLIGMLTILAKKIQSPFSVRRTCSKEKSNECVFPETCLFSTDF